MEVENLRVRELVGVESGSPPKEAESGLLFGPVHNPPPDGYVTRRNGSAEFPT